MAGVERGNLRRREAKQGVTLAELEWECAKQGVSIKEEQAKMAKVANVMRTSTNEGYET